jgi:hypothetical protein
VDAIVLDPRERARVRENPGHRRARNDQPSRGFLLPKPESGELESTRGEKKETDQNPVWDRSFRFRMALEISVKNRLLAIKKGELFFFFSRLMYR